LRVSDLLHMNVVPSLREPVLLLAFEGWNDAGEAATSAARYLENAAKAVDLAAIDCEDFFDFTVCRPRVRLDAEGVREIEWPECRFSFGSLDGNRDIVIGTGIEPHLRWRTFSDLVARLTQRLGIQHVILLGAYLADVLYSRPVAVTGFASESATLERLGVSPSSYEGPTGLVGVLGDRFRRDGLEVLSLWAGLPHYISATPNPRGALALLQNVAKHLSLGLDEEPLRNAAVEFEERVSALVAADPELSEYVRELKRREFAQ
jgi:proteasome assembly chaperone (PAC2) family protein